MIQPEELTPVIAPGEDQHVAILSELERILTSSYFRTSRRYPVLLRFIVESVLAGRSEELKERTLGIEIFHRIPTYDTTLDPIVRVTAAEVRKRLNRYYADPSNLRDVRIILEPGSYVPQFGINPHHTNNEEITPQEAQTSDVPTETAYVIPVGEKVRAKTWWALASLITVLITLSAFEGWHRWHVKRTSDAMTDFWQPFLQQGSPVLLCLGSSPHAQSSDLPAGPTSDMNLLDALQHYNGVPIADASTAAKISNFLGSREKLFRIMTSERTSFDDLQNNPAVLIGALNNQWTIRLTSKLRFYFEDSPLVSSIRDREATHQPDWNIYRTKDYSHFVQDYAVVARYRDETTGKIVIIAGGVGPDGTLAAGEFLTKKDDLKALLASAPKNWSGNGVEAVITTQVINGNSGPPHVIAKAFW